MNNTDAVSGEVMRYDPRVHEIQAEFEKNTGRLIVFSVGTIVVTACVCAIIVTIMIVPGLFSKPATCGRKGVRVVKTETVGSSDPGYSDNVTMYRTVIVCNDGTVYSR